MFREHYSNEKFITKTELEIKLHPPQKGTREQSGGLSQYQKSLNYEFLINLN